jgi:hypothetical protein
MKLFPSRILQRLEKAALSHGKVEFVCYRFGHKCTTCSINNIILLKPFNL